MTRRVMTKAEASNVVCPAAMPTMQRCVGDQCAVWDAVAPKKPKDGEPAEPARGRCGL